MFKKIKDQSVIDKLFKYKSHIFNAPFSKLSANQLLLNLQSYTKQCNAMRVKIIGSLKDRIENIYIDEKLKQERLEEYTSGLVRALKFTSVIQAFTLVCPQFMPPYNELKHFNAYKIKAAYEEKLKEEEQARLEEEKKGPFNMTYEFNE